ncbi:DUF1801 domain-containing protein [Undibacterium terreum]|uniref:YdhG-like domain-containing protein n=1 Tax=Undibacterium terreum TaxID=1224302 RepID=A0A916US10_9BURK|nr:DUF1801 domain-containing protein [Undibacterium terreum]GGC85557.1 hypothetical protein GCM10011396_36110 [Undibacterium terreum]
MAEAKTRPTDQSIDEFLARISEEGRRNDCVKIAELMQHATGAPPVIWGSSIVGFGSYRLRYDSGKEADWPLIAFSPRKNDLTLYIMPGFQHYEALLAQLGKFKTGKSCLYLKKLSDINLDVLASLIGESVQHMRKKWPASKPG